jgi:transposase
MRYSVFPLLDANGGLVHQRRVNHERGAIWDFLKDFPEGTAVALESVGKGRLWLERAVAKPPPETGRCVRQELDTLDALYEQISALEDRIARRVALTTNIQLLKTLPGVADILAIVTERELGSIDRFPAASHLASHSGVVPKVHSSGGKVRYGRLRKQSNQYLKWAFIEAANVVVRHRSHPNWRGKHVSILYERIRRRKDHAVAVGALARLLAEAAFWALKKGNPYKDPAQGKDSPKQVSARAHLVPPRTVS